MGRNLLLCIGCNDYIFVDSLWGAENDAKNIYNQLVLSDYGVYQEEDSVLLLSPDLNGFRVALSELQECEGPIQSVTIYFAGHGAARNGSYYLCVNDSRSDRLSTTAMALSYIFELFNELKVSHYNILIDACEAGGMVESLGVLLKAEVIGRAKSSGFTIFVSSASDQYASEDSNGGFGTSAILRVLRGEIDTGARGDYLDLLEVGRFAAKLVADDTNGSQNPSVWGMNLYGVFSFSINPYAENGQNFSVFKLTGISPGSPAGKVISEGAAEVAALMFVPPRQLSMEKILAAVRPQVIRLSEIPGAPSKFVVGLWWSLRDSVRAQENSYAYAEFLALSIVLLLPTAVSDEESSSCIAGFAEKLCEELASLTNSLALELEGDSKVLFRNGIPDLFYMPLRLARILGWAAAAEYISRELGLELDGHGNNVAKISRVLVDKYASVVSGMSESEAPFWSIYLSVWGADKESELPEIVVGMLYSSLVMCHGALASSDLESSRVLEYLNLRALGEEGIYKFSGHPSETLALVMLVSKFMGLDDVVDEDLVSLDHASLHVFIPTSYSDFAEGYVRHGRNHVFQIGHGIWCVNDFVNRWADVCSRQLACDEALGIKSVRIGALCSALTHADRVPWFVVDEALSRQ